MEDENGFIKSSTTYTDSTWQVPYRLVVFLTKLNVLGGFGYGYGTYGMVTHVMYKLRNRRNHD